MATFGRPVSGPSSDDERWLVNPLSYDPTRPAPLTEDPRQHAETHLVRGSQSLSTPIGDAAPLGSYAATTTADVDIGLLAELGQAVTRSAEEVRGEELHSRWRQPATADAHASHPEHVAQPVPETAPHTPEAAMVQSFASPHAAAGQVGPYQQPQQQ